MTIVPAADGSRFDWSPLESRVAAHLGLRADDTTRTRLAEAARERIEHLRLASLADYVTHLDGDGGAGELHQLAQSLTIGESYFLRGSDHFAALVESVVPERLRLRSTATPLRFLSAGCSSGEEIYSIAITLADHFPQLSARDVELVGVDITEAALVKARRGLYTPWSLRDVPADVIDRHFRVEKGRYELAPAIRERVRFERANLSDPRSPFPGGRFDVIFCRNVLIYFTPEAMRDTLDRFADALAPGGVLFVGHSESLRGLTRRFRLCRHAGSFHYQLLDVPDATSSLLDEAARREYGWGAPVAPAGRRVFALGPRPEEDGTDWMEAIGRTRRRIEALAQARPTDPGAPASAPAPSGTYPRDAERCFREDQHAAVVRLLADAHDPFARLLHAAALAQLGRLRDAEAACGRLRADHPLHADAVCLLALCREQAGDAGGARELAQQAAYLDPHFAAPQLVLARLARRAHDGAAARRALIRALQLLGDESEGRVLVFGGGFSASTLADLARAQLTVSGSAA